VLELIATLSLGGCALPGRSVTCTDTGAPRKQLAIDVHSHIFNGSDLQVQEFFSQTIVKDDDKKSELYQLARFVSGLLQGKVWDSAPAAADEAKLIAASAQALCGAGGGSRTVRDVARADFLVGRQVLVDATARNAQVLVNPGVLGPSVQPGELARAVSEMGRTLDEFEAQRRSSATVLGTHATLGGFFDFVIHAFNHRFVNADSYFDTYKGNAERSVDLLVSSLVDYDWWLAKGRRTASPLPDQLEAMAQVSTLYKGRVHGFVPFCPFRELMTSKDGKPGDSMNLVMSAIDKYGFIGVKLYPPMGFAAWDNAEVEKLGTWRSRPTLPAIASQPGFGKALDDALHRLYVYCTENEVPIMAHSNTTNGPYAAFRELAGSRYWEAALKAHPGLRVSFGHFGDSDLEDDPEHTRTRAFMKLMAMPQGRNVYADSGFFAGILTNPVGVEGTLRDLFVEPGSMMHDRFMYGTDWMMTLTQKNVRNYLDEFVANIAELKKTPGVPRDIPDRFFGRNAVDFLGLRKNGANRRRLEAFYAPRKIERPQWMEKVDALG
jgi:predicted TIM-barrel fold metal-dependent hydrolase